MGRYALRIFREDLASWVPIVLVIAATSALVGVCANQFAWTSSKAFGAAAGAAGLSAFEFQAVSVTVYAEVALLALFSLSAVGAATVERCRPTFALWRLMGATPGQAGRAALLLVGIASAVGSLAGSLASVPLSALLVPAFDGMAAESFSGGLGSFTPPPFSASPAAWALSFALSVATCMLGSVAAAVRAARVRPVDSLRGGRAGRRGRGGHPILGWALVACALATPLAGLPAAESAGGQLSQAMANLVALAGLLSLLAMVAFGARGVRAALRVAGVLPAAVRSPVGRLAARAATELASRNASAMVPLAAAVGGAGGILLTTARTLEAVMRRLGFSGSFDMTDTYALIGLAAGFALATAVAVLALSARDEGRHQALLRTLGLTPRGVAAAVAWQSALVALGAALLSLVPIACSSFAALALTWMFWGAPAAYAPLPEALAAGVVVWVVLLAVRWAQVRGAVHSSPATCLRS